MVNKYYEVYVPVWNPQTKSTPVNLVIDVRADDEKLNSIYNNLAEEMRDYGKYGGEEMREAEESFCKYLNVLVKKDLIEYADNDEHDIHSVEDLESKLQDEDFETFL